MWEFMDLERKLFGFKETILLGFATGFDIGSDVGEVIEQLDYIALFVHDNEALIRGTVPDNDSEALLWFGRAVWCTLYDPCSELSFQSRVAGEENFAVLLTYLQDCDML